MFFLFTKNSSVPACFFGNSDSEVKKPTTSPLLLKNEQKEYVQKLQAAIRRKTNQRPTIHNHNPLRRSQNPLHQTIIQFCFDRISKQVRECTRELKN